MKTNIVKLLNFIVKRLADSDFIFGPKTPDILQKLLDFFFILYDYFEDDPTNLIYYEINLIFGGLSNISKLIINQDLNSNNPRYVKALKRFLIFILSPHNVK